MEEPIEIYSEILNEWECIQQIIDSSNQEQAFYICNINDIIEKYKNWIKLMPTIKPFYAVKCNNHPVLLETLGALGAGFDCASKAEIKQVCSLGVNSDRIIFANPTKIVAHITYANKVKVNMMTFDNELELHKMKDLHSNPEAIIRIRYDDVNAGIILGLKFGCDFKTEALHLLKVAKEIGVNVIGVAFHVGSTCKSPTVFHGAIAAARLIFDLANEVGFTFNILDIGGGFPGKMDNSLEKFAVVINSALKKYFSDESIQIVSEPGAYFAESAFTLACNVHSVRETTIHDPKTKKLKRTYMYYLNDGIFTSFNDVITGKAIRIPIPLKKILNCEKYISTIWGPTLDSCDKIIDEILLPKLEFNDWVVFPNMGSYTLTFASSFSGFEHPDVYHIINKDNCELLKKTLLFTMKENL